MRAPARVRDAIVDLLADCDEPDVQATAVSLVDLLEAGDRDVLLLAATEELIRQELGHLRIRGNAEPTAVGESRWKRLHRLGLDELGMVITIAGIQVWVENCTADDLTAYAAEQRDRSAALARKSRAAATYARKLRQSGYGTVGEWVRAGSPDLPRLEVAA